MLLRQAAEKCREPVLPLAFSRCLLSFFCWEMAVDCCIRWDSFSLGSCEGSDHFPLMIRINKLSLPFTLRVRLYLQTGKQVLWKISQTNILFFLSPLLYCRVPAGAICDEHLYQLNICLGMKLWSEISNAIKSKFLFPLTQFPNGDLNSLNSGFLCNIKK